MATRAPDGANKVCRKSIRLVSEITQINSAICQCIKYFLDPELIRSP